MRHPNIVSLEDVVVGTKRDDVYLVFEYCRCVAQARLSPSRARSSPILSTPRGSSSQKRPGRRVGRRARQLHAV